MCKENKRRKEKIKVKKMLNRKQSARLTGKRTWQLTSNTATGNPAREADADAHKGKKNNNARKTKGIESTKSRWTGGHD